MSKMKNPKSEDEVAADKILVELPKRNRELAQLLTKEINAQNHQSLDPFQRKRKKLQILAAMNRPLLEEIVSHLAAQHGCAGKTMFSTSMVSFWEGMPELRGEEIRHYRAVCGGNYKKI